MKALPKALLLMSIATAMATGVTARAGDGYSYDGTTRIRTTTTTTTRMQAPRLTFTHTPQWQQVSGTPVFMVRDEDRPDFDMFRYGNTYYIYDNGNWFRANRWNGTYQWFDEAYVPSALARVPEAEWRSYPSAWGYTETSLRRDPNDPRVLYEERRTVIPNPSIEWRSAPRWRLVPGTQVYMARNAGPMNYDMFRVGSTFYIYADNGEWYRANRWNGQFVAIDSRNVPMAISRVPEREWRSYPSEWANLGWRRNGGMDPLDYRHAPAAPRIVLHGTPQWRMITGTPVYVSTNHEADFDLFRLGNTYYLYDDGYWYRSSRWNGTFTATHPSRVPREFQRVPRNQWRDGPPAWSYR